MDQPTAIHVFLQIARRVVWCPMTTVDRRGRPRARIVHPLWERGERDLVGWVATRPTPIKRAHLARTPFVSCAYRDVNHDVAIAECAAAWVEDLDERVRVWEAFAATKPPVGYDPATIWPAPDDPGFAVLRLDPWRVTAGVAAELTTGGAARIWSRSRASTTRGEMPCEHELSSA